MDETDNAPASQPDPVVGEKGYLTAFIQWFYLHGNRGVLSFLLLGIIFVVCLLMIREGLITPTEADNVTALSGALIGGMLPFITVVLAINQLILSEEFGTTGTFYERLEASQEYRRTVGDHTGYQPSPVEPSEFLRILIEAKRRTALGLRNICLDASPELHRDVVDYVETTASRDKRAIKRLDDATFGSFVVISVILHYNDSWQLQEVRQFRSGYRHRLSEPARRQLDRLEDLLQDIHVARQYFKTVYMQQELADLSKILLYVGFPTLLGGAFVILSYRNLLALELHSAIYILIVATTVTALFSPFAVLLFYVLRVATIARRTAADFGPFVLQQQLPQEDIETSDVGD
ncbi:hypothetical protein [Saliphagus sp. LR7]|uniref:hypothetical protein n=1 Tax=Saliphagus sp. LR7 TaxID=2282654 RepID=UPI000DF7611E|nr:hypothetical protein [Saliphagus sp. LR7]